MPAILMPLPRSVFWDTDGAPLCGGWVYVFVPGGSVPKLTYQDAAQAIPNSNPILLDAYGSALIYGPTGSYQFVVTDAAGNEQAAYSGVVTI